MDDYYTKLAKSTKTFLSRWNGANAELWSMQRSHRTLFVVLYRENPTRENLVLSCVDPTWITGPIYWNNCNVEVEIVEVPGTEYLSFIVKDRTAGLDVRCGGFSVREHVKI